jgi:mannosyltransferase
VVSTKKPSLNKLSYKWWLWPGLATILGLLLRLSFIAKASIWHDEGFSIMLARRSSAQIWAGSARDVHPPGYYELLHWWMKLFGSSETSVRSLSMLAGVLIVPLGYIIVRRIASQRAAVLASFMLALAPFLVRYSQETRMYGVLGLFLLVALFAVIEIVEQPKRVWPYVLYTLSVTAGLYTHYFTALAVIAFWIFLLLLTPIRKWQIGKTLWLTWQWWVANIAALLLFLPWLPTMFSQLRRGQGLSWLPVATIQTLPDTLWQFFSFTDGHALTEAVYWLAPLLILASVVYVWLRDTSENKFARLLVVYAFVPIVIGLAVSIKKPIFHERYFAFAAIAIYMLVAIAIDWLAGKRQWLFVLLAALILIGECVGVYDVYAQSDHQMRQVMAEVNQQYMPGDKLVAGELYTYFDGSYYNHTGQTMQLYTNGSPPNGYGESSLLYNQNVYLGSYWDVPAGSRVWMVGKTGNQSYYNQIPPNWLLLHEYDKGYSEIRLYQVQ